MTTRPRCSTAERNMGLRRTPLIVVLWVAALVGAACSGAAEADRATDTAPAGGDLSGAPEAPESGNDATDTAPTQEPVADPERFGGSDDEFYVVPDPLPAGGPGDLIRYQVVDAEHIGDGPARTTVRVMYHSQDAAGNDRATTGIVTYPDADPPPGGWPVVSYGHGTAGMAPRCAPSRDGQPAPGWGVEGVWAATDYVGLGPVGEVHPYLSKHSEGNAMIDIVRAAAQVPGADAGRRWVAVGHSQGGHGALAAHELAGDRAPELDLVATAAIAPGVDIDTDYGVDEELMDVLTMMQLYGGGTEHDDIDVSDYFTAEATRGAEVFRTGCVDEIVFELTAAVADGPFEVDPWSTEPAESMLRENQVGTRAVTDTPVLLVSGTADRTVVAERVADFFDKLCAAGQPAAIREIRGADHGSVIPRAYDQIARFLEQNLQRPDQQASAPDDASDSDPAGRNPAAQLDECR